MNAAGARWRGPAAAAAAAVTATAALAPFVGAPAAAAPPAATATTTPPQAPVAEPGTGWPAPGAAAELTATLARELESIGREPETIQRDARAAFRRVAYDLLFRGASAPPGAQAMAVAGFRLAGLRAAVDAIVDACPADGPTAEALRRFTASAAHGVVADPAVGVVAPEEPERALVPMMAPLRQALGAASPLRAPRRDGAWPLPAALARAARTAPDPAGGTDFSIERIAAACNWIPRELAMRLASLDAGAGAARTPLAREIAAALPPADSLAASGKGWASDDLRAAFAAAADARDPSAARALRQAIEAAHAIAGFSPAELPPELRRAATEACRPGLAQAAGAGQALAAVAAGREPPAAQANALRVVRESNADLARIQAARTWPDAIGAMHAPSRRMMESTIRGWCQALPAPRGAQAARAAMDAFAGELAAFRELRLEAAMRHGDAAARAAAGGSADPLLAEIDRRRAAWAAGWVTGKGNADAAAAMRRAAHVMESLAAAASLAGGAEAERRLARWGGFGAPEEGLGINPAALTGRARLAAEALIDRRDAEVDAQLGSLAQALPAAWLVALLADRLDPWLAGRDDTVAALDAAIQGPAAGAWLEGSRAALMDFARLAHEESFARRSHRGDTAAELRTRVAAAAAGILATSPELAPDAADAPAPATVTP